MAGLVHALGWVAAILTAAGWFLMPVVCLSHLPMPKFAFWSAAVLFWLIATKSITTAAWPHAVVAALLVQIAAGIALVVFVCSLGQFFAAANERRRTEEDTSGGQHARDDQ